MAFHEQSLVLANGNCRHHRHHRNSIDCMLDLTRVPIEFEISLEMLREEKYYAQMFSERLPRDMIDWLKKHVATCNLP